MELTASELGKEEGAELRQREVVDKDGMLGGENGATKQRHNVS